MTTPRRVTAAVPELRESDVTKQCRGWMESRGWYSIRLQAGTVRALTGATFMKLGAKGLPDWCFVRAREVCFIEMKRPGNKPSQDQRRWIEWAEVAGTPAFWADSLEMLQVKYGKWFVR